MSFPRSPTKRHAELRNLPTMEYTRKAGMMQCYQDLLISAVEVGQVPDDPVELLEWAADFFDSFADKWESGEVNDRMLALLRIQNKNKNMNNNERGGGRAGREVAVASHVVTTKDEVHRVSPSDSPLDHCVVQLERTSTPRSGDDDEEHMRECKEGVGSEEKRGSIADQFNGDQKPDNADEKHSGVVELEQKSIDNQLRDESEAKHESNYSVGNELRDDRQSNSVGDVDDENETSEIAPSANHNVVEQQAHVNGNTFLTSDDSADLAILADDAIDNSENEMEEQAALHIQRVARGSMDRRRSSSTCGSRTDNHDVQLDTTPADDSSQSDGERSDSQSTSSSSLEDTADAAAEVVKSVVDVSLRRMSFEIADRNEKAAIGIQKVVRGSNARRNSADRDAQLATEMGIASTDDQSQSETSNAVDVGDDDDEERSQHHGEKGEVQNEEMGEEQQLKIQEDSSEQQDIDADSGAEAGADSQAEPRTIPEQNQEMQDKSETKQLQQEQEQEQEAVSEAGDENVEVESEEQDLNQLLGTTEEDLNAMANHMTHDDSNASDEADDEAARSTSPLEPDELHSNMQLDTDGAVVDMEETTEPSDSREAAAAAIQARVREAAEKRKASVASTGNAQKPSNAGTVSLM